MRPLKLAFIVNLYPPYVVGGNELLAREVIEGLRRRGHEVHVLTGRGRDLPKDGFTHGAIDLDLDRKEEVFLGAVPVTPARFLRWHLYWPPSEHSVRDALDRVRPELVVVWNLYGASMAPLVGARRSGVPVVAQPADRWLLWGLHDLSPLAPNPRAWSRAALAMMRTLVQPMLKQIAMPDRLLTVSEFIRGLHVAAGFPRERIRATHLGVPVELFPIARRDPPRGRPWRLLFAGQLWEGKGPQVAIEALRRLRERPGLPPFVLDVFGSGAPDFLALLRRRVDEARLGDVVTLHGFVPRERLAQEMATHDVFLFCSTWDEPFSGGLLEALCTGLPTIATRIGGTPEAIRDGDNGLLVPPGDATALADALARLMGDEALLAGLAERAAADVRARWTFEAYIDRLEAEYEAVARGSARA